MLSSLIRREAAREAIGSHGTLKTAIVGAVLLLAINGCAPTIADYGPTKPCDGSRTPCGSPGGPPYAVTPSGGPNAPPISPAHAAIVNHPNTGKARSEAHLTTVPPEMRAEVEEIRRQA